MKPHKNNTGVTGQGFILPESTQTRPNLREGITMSSIDMTDDVNAEYSCNIPNTQKHQPLPCKKTDVEINNQWEYNKLMGRGILPGGIE